MRLFLTILILISSGVSAEKPLTCASGLSSGEAQDLNQSEITKLLQVKGSELGASLIGLFEVQLKNGEVLLSKLYWSTDEIGRPIEDDEIAGFKAELKKSVKAEQINQVNMWLLAPATGGRVIQKISL